MIGQRNAIDTAELSLSRRVAALKSAAGLATDRLDEDAVQFANAIVAKADERMRHGTEHLLVALLGATGSGKSSLANALTSSEVAIAGVRRPTTSSTSAFIWGPDEATGLLHWLGVQKHHQILSSNNASETGNPVAQDSDLAGLVLLDVPDHDSVEVSHRLEMEQIAEHADVLIWVTDPEKYGDEVLHAYLRRLSHHGSAMVVVLNKSDLLTPEEVALCRQDLRRLLDEAELVDTPVIVTSATQSETGAAEIRYLIKQRLKAQESVMMRLEADLFVAAADLFDAATGTRPKATPEGVSKASASTLTADLGHALGTESIVDVVATGYRLDAKLATGWPFIRWVARLKPNPLRKLHLDAKSSGRTSLPPVSPAQRTRIMASIRDTAERASDGLPAPWPAQVRDAGRPDETELFDQLDAAVGTGARTIRPRNPRWWRIVGLLQWALALTVIAGAGWLTALAGAAWLQLPDVPTPTVMSLPVPTLLLVGGAVAGFVLALLARLLASIGAKRAHRAATNAIAKSIGHVSDELVVAPITTELVQRQRLLDNLRIVQEVRR